MARRLADLVTAPIARLLRSHGFERKGRTFLLRREPTFSIVQIQASRFRGIKLHLSVTSELESRSKGWTIEDPYREGIVSWTSGPSYLEPGGFEEWEQVPDEAAARELGERWARWIEAKGLAFLEEGVEELNRTYKA